MDGIERRENRFERIYRCIAIIYCAISCALALVYGLRGDGYHLGASLGTLAIPLGLFLFHRALKLPISRLVYICVLVFSFLAYTLGTCLDLYSLMQYYDKLVHMLSGVLVSLLCDTLYGLLHPERPANLRERAIWLLFVFFGSMAVAGLWEIGEYILSFITGRDLQRVLTTGVGDSMQDMIVCLIGTLLYLVPSAAAAAGSAR